MKINIVGISGSPRKGSTQYCVQEALRAASEIDGVETKFIDLRAKKSITVFIVIVVLKNMLLIVLLLMMI
ncbi:MAG: NAD(P)H-dependent oxidoreductase [Spirochaetales bacterium]|nr:NAD(P)H-dependent oxidoreductase [Spirochaetales bacterium]